MSTDPVKSSLEGTWVSLSRRSRWATSSRLTFPLLTEGVLKSMIEAPVLPPLDANEVVGGVTARVKGGYELTTYRGVS